MAKMEPNEFFRKLAPVVIPIAKKYGLPPSIALAQAAIESGWGEHTIGQHNYFGRKWGGWGKYIELPTEEQTNGERFTIRAKFQDYDSLEQAIEDYYVLLTQDPQYAPALEHKNNLEKYVRAYTETYATDEKSADKILDTIRANRLTDFDGDYDSVTVGKNTKQLSGVPTDPGAMIFDNGAYWRVGNDGRHYYSQAPDPGNIFWSGGGHWIMGNDGKHYYTDLTKDGNYGGTSEQIGRETPQATGGMTPEQSAASDKAVSQGEATYVPYEGPTVLSQFADYLSERIWGGGGK